MAATLGQRDPFAEWEESNHLHGSPDSSSEPTQLVSATPPSPRPAPAPTRVARFSAPGYSGEDVALLRQHLRAKELLAALAVGAAGAVLGVVMFFLAFSHLQAPKPVPASATALAAPLPAPARVVVQAPPEVSTFEGELEPLPKLPASAAKPVKTSR